MGRCISIFCFVALVILSLSIQTRAQEEYAPHIKGRPTWGIIPDSDVAVMIYEKNGLAILDGDIMLGAIEDIEITEAKYNSLKMTKRTSNSSILVGGNLRFQPSRRWPGGRVPFAINAALPNHSRIYEAIAHWERLTPLTFAPWDGSARDYVQFNPDPTTTCSSSVGRVGGRQIILLAERCTAMIVVHEIGHAIGFYHEQSRLDRDDHVKILWDAIQTDKFHNFEKYDASNTRDYGRYDYGSIMHYGASSFPKVPNTVTIVSPEPIGQRNGLSPLDIETAKYFYTPIPVRIFSTVPTSWRVTSLPLAVGAGFSSGAILYQAQSTNGLLEIVYRAPSAGVVSTLKTTAGSVLPTDSLVLEIFGV